MAPGWQKVVVAASLHNVGNCSAIDLDIENYVPSKGRNPQNNQTSTRLSDGASDGDYADKNENEKDCGGGVYPGFIAACYGSDSFLASAALVDFWTLLVDCPCPGAVRSCRPAILPQLSRGQAQSGWAQINESRIPRRNIYIGQPRLDVHCCRSGSGIPCVWYLGHG